MNIKDSEFKDLLSKYKKFAVYGLSADQNKASHYVPLYMRNQGWEIVGIYPKTHSESGFKIYEKLSEIPIEFRKFLEVFRNSDSIPQVVDEAIAVGGIEVLWLQLGITHPEAERRAENAGIKVVSNRCLLIEHKRWF